MSGETQNPQAPTSPRPARFRSARRGDTTVGSLLASLATAGWSKDARILVGEGPFESLSWGNLRTLAAARDEKLRGLCDIQPDAAMREAWMNDPPARPRIEQVRTPLRFPAGDGPERVLLIGDTGDGSQAQRAVAIQLLERAGRPGAHLGAEGVRALLIESDIVYPAGAWNEYQRKFRQPYEDILNSRIPMYAVPGNHDWDDGSLTGFMRTFCGLEQAPTAVAGALSDAGASGPKGWLRWLLWTPHRNPAPPPPPTGLPSGDAPAQTAPYFALDIGGALFIGIDTGYDSVIDIQQARWLVDLVERHSGQPKILFTGKPLIVNGHRQKCSFTPLADDQHDHVNSTVPGVPPYRSVDDVVRRPQNGFVLAAGGDVHNYERYVARITPRDRIGERVLPYVVCGGGGVFIGQTYWLESVDIHDVAGEEVDTVRCAEAETVLFPTRPHSRLFVDAITRRAARHTRFSTPIGLAAAAAATALFAVASRLSGDGFPSPQAIAAVPLLLTATGVNMSARPITGSGRIASLAAGLVGAVFVRYPGGGRGLLDASQGQTQAALAAGLVGGIGLFLLGDWDARNQHVRSVASAAGWCVTVAAAVGVLAARSSPHRTSCFTIAAIAAVSGLVLAYVCEIPHRLTVQQANRLSKPPRGLTGWVARRQKLFSIYETFTDGRLTDRTRLRGPGAPQDRVRTPIYRSFLEIEFRRPTDADSRWRFAFTAFAVTGEANTEAPPDPETVQDPPEVIQGPVVIDAFEVGWEPGSLEFTPQPAAPTVA